MRSWGKEYVLILGNSLTLDNRRPIGIKFPYCFGLTADPPPAVSVSILRSGENGSQVGLYIRAFFSADLSPAMEAMSLFLQATLVDMELKPVVVQNRERQMTALVGVTNTTMHRITIPDERLRTQCVKGIFAFTDLSVRQEGNYYLRWDLFEIINGEAIHRHEVYSAKFKVYPAKNFPGMQQSTALTDLLKKYGIRVRVSKSTRTAKQRGNQVRRSRFDPEIFEQHQLHINPASASYSPYDQRVPYAPKISLMNRTLYVLIESGGIPSMHTLSQH